MKSLIFSFVAVLFIAAQLSISAQIKNIDTGDSSVIINGVYAGMLSENYFSQDSLDINSVASFRIGAAATYIILPGVSVTSSQVYETDMNGRGYGISRFWIKTSYNSFDFETGLLISPATMSRPNPVGTGQFETWTEARIPGGGLGAKIKYNFGQNYVNAGVMQRGGLPEYHARFSSPSFKVSIYYPEVTKKFGASVKAEAGKVSLVTAFSAGEFLATFIAVPVDSEAGIDVYTDLGYSLSGDKKILRGEVGILKSFSGEVLKGLIGLGYCYEKRSIAGYLYIHI